MWLFSWMWLIGGEVQLPPYPNNPPELRRSRQVSYLSFDRGVLLSA